MAKVCQLTGARKSVGHNVSHSNRKTKRTFKVNLISKRIVDPVSGKTLRVKMTARAYRTFQKNPGKFATELKSISKKQAA